MKIALIGCGYWGSKINKYLPKYFSVKYVANSKFDKNIIWKDKEISAVIIATPINTHYRIAKEALKNGKHIFVEKPITLYEEEALELKKIAETNDLKIGVEYTQTFSPSINKALKLINTIGDLEFIEMSTKHLGRFFKKYNVYWLLASHHLSILDMIIPLEKLEFSKSDFMKHNNLCTTGSLNFGDKKSIGKIDVSTNYPGKDMYINIYGNKGTIQWNPFIIPTLTITIYNKNFKKLPSELIKSEQKINYDENNNLKYSIKYFKNLLENKVKSNINTAIKITRILEQYERI